MKHNNTGKIAETIAVWYFILHGFAVVKRNFITGRGTGAGEIDLIVTKKNLLVFVEVKKRKNIEDAAYSIKESQQKRIWKAAENFIKNNPKYNEQNIRFDAFLVKSIFSFKHFPDAWRVWE
ncbi:MAG: YraN family protein [Alphaproteobacteria bacterium]|nr:YraN family protein [Alphaproteobacteria bacterium]